MNFDITPVFVSFKLSLITTVLLFFIAFPPAFYMARSSGRLKHVLDVLFTLPLVLPPTVLGFYLLLLLSPAHYPGKLIKELFDIRLVFNFTGMVIAALVFSLPFMVRSLKDGMESIDPAIIEASYTLGKSTLQTIWLVVLPAGKGAVFTALSTTFAHTMGCFGVVLMVGGNIPGVTKTASIAVYERVEMIDYTGAHLYSVILLLVCFLLLMAVKLIKIRAGRK